MKLHKVKLD